MKRFLTELEHRLAALPRGERDELADAVRTLVKATTMSTATIGARFKPSKAAVLGVLTELVGALGGGGGAMLGKIKALAPSIGPNVAALVQAL